MSFNEGETQEATAQSFADTQDAKAPTIQCHVCSKQRILSQYKRHLYMYVANKEVSEDGVKEILFQCRRTRKDTKVTNIVPRFGFTCYHSTHSGQCKMVVLDLKRHLIKTHKMDQFSEAFEELIQRSIENGSTERSIRMKRSLDNDDEERPNGPRKYVSYHFEFDSEDSNCHPISKRVTPGLSKESSSAFHSEIVVSPLSLYDKQIPSSSQQALPPILQTPCHEISSNALSFVDTDKLYKNLKRFY